MAQVKAPQFLTETAMEEVMKRALPTSGDTETLTFFVDDVEVSVLK
jgi:hypothetical protein